MEIDEYVELDQLITDVIDGLIAQKDKEVSLGMKEAMDTVMRPIVTAKTLLAQLNSVSR
jgi:hypothetical protein